MQYHTKELMLKRTTFTVREAGQKLTNHEQTPKYEI